MSENRWDLTINVVFLPSIRTVEDNHKKNAILEGKLHKPIQINKMIWKCDSEWEDVIDANEYVVYKRQNYLTNLDDKKMCMCF